MRASARSENARQTIDTTTRQLDTHTDVSRIVAIGDDAQVTHNGVVARQQREQRRRAVAGRHSRQTDERRAMRRQRAFGGAVACRRQRVEVRTALGQLHARIAGQEAQLVARLCCGCDNICICSCCCCSCCSCCSCCHCCWIE
jgi:hypothetical protein